MTDRLDVAFEGPRVDDAGVPFDDFRKTLDHLQRALRLMVGHLAGADLSSGRPPDLVREQSALRLLGTSQGSLVAELGVAPPGGAQLRQERYGSAALEAITGAAGLDDPALPAPVRESLAAIGADLSPEIVAASVGGAGRGRRLRIERRPRGKRRPRTESEPALARGLLLEVNWEQGTAQLHEPYGDHGRHIRLRFEPELAGDMRRLATEHVEVRGSGRFDDEGNWRHVHVESIEGTRSMREPFDMDAFLNDPHPKIFRGDEVVTAIEPFDVDEFLRTIREGRDA